MRAVTHLYCIRKLPLQSIVFIHSELGKIIQKRMNNPKRDIDIQYVRNQQILNQLNEKKKMKLWHKFTEKLPEPYKELVLRYNEYGIYEYQSAMGAMHTDYVSKERYLYIEHSLNSEIGACKSYASCEMCEKFRADKEENTEWCYLEDLCKTLENLND